MTIADLIFGWRGDLDNIIGGIWYYQNQVVSKSLRQFWLHICLIDYDLWKQWLCFVNSKIFFWKWPTLEDVSRSLIQRLNKIFVILYIISLFCGQEVYIIYLILKIDE